MDIIIRGKRAFRRCHRRFKKQYSYVIDIDGNIISGKELGDINSFWFGKKLLFHPDSWHKYAYYPSLFIGIKEPIPLTLKLLLPIMDMLMPIIAEQFNKPQSLYKYFMKEGKYKPIPQFGGREAPIMNYIRREDK